MLRDGLRARRPYVIAGLVFGAVAVAYLWPALFGSKVMYPGLANRVQSDVVQDFVPWLHYARDTIRSGQFPGWNPFVLSGAPFYANPQTAVASPVNVPVWVLPFGRGLAVSYVLKLWVGAMGAFALTRALGVRRMVPGLVAGLAYGGLAYTIVWLQAPIDNVWVFLPWMCWACERVVRDGRGRDAAWLGLASAAAFAGGHSESVLHVAVVTGAYAALRLLVSEVGARERLRRLGLVALGGVAGGLLAAAVLLPTLLNFSESAYVQGRSPRGAFHLPLDAWRTVLFPDWWGRPTAVVVPGEPFNFSERTMYAGAVALVLAAIGIVSTPWRRTIVWIVLGLVGLSAAIGLPPVYQVFSHVPPFDRVANTRLIWVLGLAVAVLAAYGTDRLLAERPGRRVFGVAAGVVAAGVLAAATLHPSFHDLRLLGNHFRTGTDWPGLIRLTSVAWFVLLAAAVLVAVLARRYAGAPVAAAILLCALVLDLGHFANGYNPLLASSFGEFPDARGHDRGLVPSLPPDAQMRTGIRDPRGHDPPQPRFRYLHLWQRAMPSQGGSQPIEIGGPVTPDATQLLRLLSVREYVGFNGDTAQDPQARPRAFVPASVTRVSGETQALDAMFARSFVPARDAVVEGPAPAAASGRVSFLRDDPGRVDLRADLERGGMVVLTDQLDRGWTVTVDGHDAQPLRVDSVLRGVSVPAGAHTVSWRYRVPGLRAGLALSALGLLLIAALALWRPRARRR